MKTFHQLISNLRAIAEPFIAPTTWLKYSTIPLNFAQIIVFYEFMRGGGGGGI